MWRLRFKWLLSDFYVMWWLILLFNKIRFENKINIEMWGSLEILESYVGERNKIRFDGNIKRKLGLDCQYIRFG